MIGSGVPHSMSPTTPYLVWLILCRYLTRMPLCGPAYEVKEIGVKLSAYLLIVLLGLVRESCSSNESADRERDPSGELEREHERGASASEPHDSMFRIVMSLPVPVPASGPAY